MKTVIIACSDWTETISWGFEFPWTRTTGSMSSMESSWSWLFTILLDISAFSFQFRFHARPASVSFVQISRVVCFSLFSLMISNIMASSLQMSAFWIQLSSLLLIHGDHCHTEEQRLHLEGARVLNLRFSIAKVYNFYCSNFDKYRNLEKGRLVSSIIRSLIRRLLLISLKKLASNLNEYRFPY